MEAQLLSARGLWLAPLLVLSIGAALIAAAAGLAVCQSAIGQRTIWQAAVLGLAGLMALEISGLGSGLVAVWRRGDTTVRVSSRHSGELGQPAYRSPVEGRPPPARLVAEPAIGLSPLLSWNGHPPDHSRAFSAPVHAVDRATDRQRRSMT